MNFHPLNFSTSCRKLWAVMTRLIADNNLNAQARTPNPASSIQDMLIILQSLQVQLWSIEYLIQSLSTSTPPSATPRPSRPSRPYCPIRTPEQIRPLKGNHTSRFSPPKLSMHACRDLRCASYFIPTRPLPFLRCTQVGMHPKAQL